MPRAVFRRVLPPRVKQRTRSGGVVESLLESRRIRHTEDLHMPLSEDAWNDLLTAITGRQVIPVIGDGAVEVPEAMGGGLLTQWLARELAARLELEMPEPSQSLNAVVSRWLILGRKRQTLYSRVTQILEECSAQLVPQQTLLDLAGVGDFPLCLTTTIDPVFLRALNQVRYGGEPRTTVSVYRPSAHGMEKDLPVRLAQLPPGGSALACLLGKPSTKPDFALWDEDLLEFILGLHRDLQSDQMKNLAYDLQDNHLLFIGLRFSDWLTRFFVRVAEQKQLSETRETSRFLALQPDSVEGSMVVFFDSLRQETQVWPIEPEEFAAELRRRWEKRTGITVQPAVAPSAVPLPGPAMPSNSIFLSYAREDFEAVRRLRENLALHGCTDVWFDLERLQAGENWRNALETEVRKRCAVFVSCISRTTAGKIGELHRERAWADDTAPIFGDGSTFYVPVLIDDISPGEVRREPLTLFKESHAIRLPGGEVPPGGTQSMADIARRLGELQTQNRRAV